MVPNDTDTLLLSNNNISHIRKPQDNYLSQVTLVDLSDGSVQLIDGDFLLSLRDGSTIYLDGNNLQLLPKDIENLPYNTNMTLGNNPWMCSCNNQWFQTWLKRRQEQIIDIDQVECGTDDENGGSLPSQPVVQAEMCPSSTWPYIIGFSIVGAIVFLAIVSTSTVYKYRREVRLLLFEHCPCMPCFESDDDDISGKTYDAFISYSETDAEFVTGELLRELEENDPKHILCIHHRDWLPGRAVGDNIADSILKSRRTIVILSMSYIRSNWCLGELR